MGYEGSEGRLIGVPEQPAPALMEVRIFIVCFSLTYVVLSTLDDNRRGKLTFHMRLELVKIALTPMSRSWKCAR